MANDELKILASINTPDIQPLAGNSAESGCKFTAEEGLRLFRAFIRIADAKQRALLIERAESIADSDAHV